MDHDTIVLGAGIIGASLAFHLADRGQRVLLLDPGPVAGGTTSASFAWANASSKTTEATYHRLNAAGVAGYRALADRFGAARLGVSATGAVRVALPHDAGGAAALDHDLAALSAQGYPVARRTGAELARANPGLALPAQVEALAFPDDLTIDAPRAAKALVAAACDLGARLERLPATGLLADDGGTVRGVETPDGHRPARDVVLATGRETGRLLARLTGFDAFATRFPLREVPGLILTTPPLDPCPLSTVLTTAGSDEFHVLPTAEGRLRMGSDDVDALVWDGPDRIAEAGAALLARAEGWLPGLSARVALEDCDLRIGVRPFPEDGRSIAGPLPGAQGLWLVVTHSGITLAPVLGDTMAEWITTGTRPAPLAPFGPDRFPGFN